jgi:hypothetical protein
MTRTRRLAAILAPEVAQAMESHIVKLDLVLMSPLGQLSPSRRLSRARNRRALQSSLK